MNPEETITIRRSDYLELIADADKLFRLECAGVDNWCGYDEAMSMDMEDD